MKKSLLLATGLVVVLALAGCGDGLTYLERQAAEAAECEKAGGHWIDRQMWTGGLEQRCSFDSQWNEEE